MENSADIDSLTIALEQEKKILVAVDAIDFNLHAGQTLALLGESGCGKSLTALSLMRLLPHFGLYGEKSSILVDQQDILNLPEFLMRQLRGRKLAMVFQEPMTALNPVLTVGEQLAECFREIYKGKALQKAMIEALKEVELPEPALKLQQYPHELSGGQKQRIVIAMALAGKPDILIADEPTTALDVTIQAQILALLKRLQERYQMSLLLITHDLGVVKAMADSVCVMYAGQIVEYQTVANFFKKVLHPYSQQLLASLPSLRKRGHLLQVVPGSVPSLDAMPSACRFHTRCAYVFEKCKIIEPKLQWIGKRQVRCHLYPEHEKLPPLTILKRDFPPQSFEKSKPVLVVDDLNVHFVFKKGFLRPKRKITKAVNGVSFELKKGETLALVGESGCGKTTLGRTLMNLVPWTGQINFHGQDVANMYGSQLQNYRKRIQMIFQDPFSSMNPRMTISEIIAEGMYVQGYSAAKIAKKQLELLDQVQLPHTALQRYPHQFSGGQRQRICIARALATDPEILICDEPTSALDISVQAQILNLLKNLQQEKGLTYLFITHNMEVVSWIADEILVMKAGKIVESGSWETVLKHPKEEYTKKLLNAVLRI